MLTSLKVTVTDLSKIFLSCILRFFSSALFVAPELTLPLAMDWGSSRIVFVLARFAGGPETCALLAASNSSSS